MDTVTLEPGQSKEVKFTYVPPEARRYTVNVNGLSKSFQALEVKILVSGKVIDDESREPVFLAYVWFSVEGVRKYKTYTDENGEYSIEIAVGAYQLQAGKPNIYAAKGLGTWNLITDSTVNFELRRLESKTIPVYGKITDLETGEPLAARIAFYRNDQQVESQLTGSDGAFSILIPAETYDIWCGKLGYTDVWLQRTLSSSTELNIQLQKD